MKELITQKDPKSPISEMFRTLRTNIQFMNTNKELKTLLITSTISGEGKSLITANLATTFAQANKKVVLIDCDMRKGRQHNIFETSSRPGLSNYLSGINSNGEDSDEDLSKYIKGTEVPNLYIFPSGNVPPNPSELIASEKMVNLLKELSELCDIVILDGTPSLIVTDSVILSRFVDSTIIVISQNKTRMDDLNKVKKDIENVGGKIAGVVINKIEVSSKQINDRYYYYGHKTNLPSKRKSNNRERDKYNNISKINNENNTSESNKEKKINEEDMLKTNEILSSLNTYLENEKNKIK